VGNCLVQCMGRPPNKQTKSLTFPQSLVLTSYSTAGTAQEIFTTSLSRHDTQCCQDLNLLKQTPKTPQICIPKILCRYTSSSTLSTSILNSNTMRSTLIGDHDAAGNQIADMPLFMEPPAQRPISPGKWKEMTLDTMRPEPEEFPAGAVSQKRGWVRKASGRPPHQSWKKRVWLFIEVRSTDLVGLPWPGGTWMLWVSLLTDSGGPCHFARTGVPWVSGHSNTGGAH
jgi:hypothetical protein